MKRLETRSKLTMLLSFLPLCPSMPLPSRKQSVQHRQQSLHYTLMRKKRMYRGTLNILDMLRKTFSIFLPPCPCHLENKMCSTDSIHYTIYSY